MERGTSWSHHGDFDMFLKCLEIFENILTHLEIFFNTVFNILYFSYFTYLNGRISLTVMLCS